MAMLKYEELRCIGRGSYGSAHLVVERSTNQRFVIKKIPTELLSDSEKQQSFREVELLAKLKHPNVVEYKENFVENNVIHIVMAYCDGGDLAGRIKERAGIGANGGHGYFDTRQILDWFVQMAMAIKYLHEQRILHRDLKTSNIFLTTQNVIKLGDFGIAKTLDSTLDQAKTVVGTPYYMSPEVCESKPYSYASDVWSLGCVLYEMVALRHAFDAPNILTLILKIVQNDFAAVPAHYDSDISEILRSLLDKQPNNRPTMDQIFMMPYIRNHMQALIESGGSLQKVSMDRRPHGTPKRRVHAKSVRPSPVKGKTRHHSASGPRWAAITPNDREDILLGEENSDLELLETSSSIGELSVDIRLPERSKTPEPLLESGVPDEASALSNIQHIPVMSEPRVIPKKAPARYRNNTAWVEQPQGLSGIGRRPSGVEEIEEELDSRFQLEAAEALMNPNFQRVYAEECDDSLTVKYAPQSRSRVRQQQREPQGQRRSARSLKPQLQGFNYAPRRVFDLVGDQSHRMQTKSNGPEIRHIQRVQRGEVQASHQADFGSVTLTLSLDDSTASGGEHSEETANAATLSDSGMLRQLELEEASSGDENEEDHSSNSDSYEGEENFYSEHSAYSDDSDFSGDENKAEYSDDFEELDGEIIEYAGEEFGTDDDSLIIDGVENTSESASTGGLLHTPVSSVRSPNLGSSPSTRRPPKEVQWVMRNVAQSLIESCENLSVA